MAVKATDIGLGKSVNLVGASIENGGYTVKKWTVKIADFTDGGGATGTVQLTPAIPAGSILLGIVANVKTALGCGTSANTAVGDGSTADCFSQNTDSILNLYSTGIKALTSLNGADENANATPNITSDKTITLTVTDGGGDFTTAVSAAVGEFDFYVFYLHLPLDA